MTYAVIAPKKFALAGYVKPTVDFISDDIEAAKRVAKQTKEAMLKKGWKSWANKVRLVSPNNAEGLLEIAEMALEYGQELDWASNGNSFVAVDLIQWANTLRVRADQMVSPESYAD